MEIDNSGYVGRTPARTLCPMDSLGLARVFRVARTCRWTRLGIL
jgi:hypothetical protein